MQASGNLWDFPYEISMQTRLNFPTYDFGLIFPHKVSAEFSHIRFPCRLGWMARLGQLYCFVADSVTAAGQKNTSCWCVEINLKRTEILKDLFSASAGKENNKSQNPPPNQCEQIFESSSQHNCEQKATFDFRGTLAHLCLSPDSHKIYFFTEYSKKE